MNANRVTSDRGYLVIEPNIRGSTGYVIAFRDIAFKDWGGLMKYMAATKEPALWYAAVPWIGISDLQALWAEPKEHFR